MLHHGPGVRHSLSPRPNEPLVHLAIQHPAMGYRKDEWALHPEAGTANAFGDLAAFVRQFGADSGADIATYIRSGKIWQSERWKHLVTERAQHTPTPDEPKPAVTRR